MDINCKDTSEILKNTTETAKNLLEIIQGIIRPKGLDATIQKGHEKIIEDIINSDEYSITQKQFFLSTYKKQIKEYKNCKQIAESAYSNIIQISNIHKVDPDWFVFYFEKAKLVTNESMQKIWASILAEEINTPDSISRSFIHMLSIIDRKEADVFCNLCRFCWFDLDYDKIHPFIYISKEHTAYYDSDITWDRLKALEFLGLINCDLQPGYVLKGPRRFRTGNIVVNVEGDPQRNHLINVGNVMFSRNGRKLYDLVDAQYKQYRNDIFSFIENKLCNYGCKVMTTNVVRRHF